MINNLSEYRQDYIPIRFYLAGPLAGCNESEQLDWRLQFIKSITEIFVGQDESETWSRYRKDGKPLRPEFIVPEVMNTLTARQQENLVVGDLQSIRNSDIVIANMWKASIGTSMEVYYTHHSMIECITLNPTHSPWAAHFGGYIANNLSEVLHRINEILTEFLSSEDGYYEGLVDYPIQVFRLTDKEMI